MKSPNITTETIDLSRYFFTGRGFHWPNIAVSLAEWPNWQWTEEKHRANMATDSRDLFWFRYKDIELDFNVGKPTTVDWAHSEGLHQRGFFITTPVVLPKDPAQLLQLLELTSHPEAGNIAQFWLALQQYLGYLSRFEGNVVWP